MTSELHQIAMDSVETPDFYATFDEQLWTSGIALSPLKDACPASEDLNLSRDGGPDVNSPATSPAEGSMEVCIEDLLRNQKHVSDLVSLVPDAGCNDCNAVMEILEMSDDRIQSVFEREWKNSKSAFCEIFNCSLSNFGEWLRWRKTSPASSVAVRKYRIWATCPEGTPVSRNVFLSWYEVYRCLTQDAVTAIHYIDHDISFPAPTRKKTSKQKLATECTVYLCKADGNVCFSHSVREWTSAAGIARAPLCAPPAPQGLHGCAPPHPGISPYSVGSLACEMDFVSIVDFMVAYHHFLLGGRPAAIFHIYTNEARARTFEGAGAMVGRKIILHTIRQNCAKTDEQGVTSPEQIPTPGE